MITKSTALRMGISLNPIDSGTVTDYSGEEYCQRTMEEYMTIRHVTRYAGILARLCFATWAAPVDAKQCYAPDARAQERAFSRAVITEGGKTI